MKMKIDRNLNTIILLVVALQGVIFITSGCGFLSSAMTDETTPNSWEVFESRVGHFSITYPSTWSTEQFTKGFHSDQEAIALFTTLSPFPVVTIAQKEMALPTLDKVALWGEERILEINDEFDDEYKLFDIQYIKINGVQAATREYLIDIETSLPLKKKDVYIARDSNGLIITFATTAESYDEVIGIFEQMIASFKSQ